MIKKMFLTAASVALLAGCSACSTMKSGAGEGGTAGMGDGSAAGAAGAGAGANGGAGEAVNGFAKSHDNIVYFDFDSAAIRSDGAEALDALSAKLKADGVAKVSIEGHCDERGTREYNLALGERRAVSAKKYLAGKGMENSNMETVSYGKERPAAEGHDENAWALNRRAVVNAAK